MVICLFCVKLQEHIFLAASRSFEPDRNHYNTMTKQEFFNVQAVAFEGTTEFHKAACLLVLSISLSRVKCPTGLN